MRCLSCDEALSDKEASRKYPEPERIANPEDRYIMLCDRCIKDTDFDDGGFIFNDDVEE